MSLIEHGGIGAVRLRPRLIDEEICWLATAVKDSPCHCGIPLAIPDDLVRRAGIDWGHEVSLEGRVRYLQDAGLADTASAVHHARPLIVFVDRIEGVGRSGDVEPVVITPVALFDGGPGRDPYDYNFRPGYTFVQCDAGSDAEVERAAEWITTYATKFAGRVVTNFDERRPLLADAPLSYQRLVAKTYDRTIIERFHGEIHVDRIDRVIQETQTTQYIEKVHVGHNINVGGNANINIDSVLKDVVQTIGGSTGLKKEQKSQLEALVQSLRNDLDAIKATRGDEANEIAAALQKVTAQAAKPPQERKKSLLELSGKGLKDAAELVKDVAPTVLTTATAIAKFVAGL